MSIDVACPCGATHLQLTGEPLAHFYCHCGDCRAVHGAAYIAVAAYPTDGVKVTRGAPREWKLKVTTRASCPDCGTRLFAQRPDAPICGVNAFLLPRGSFAPSFHIFCESAQHPIRDGLAHFRTVPTAFGGSDETVDW